MKLLLIFFPADAVRRAILDGLVDLILGECAQVGDLDEAGRVHAKHRRADLDAHLAVNAIAELHNGSFHGIHRTGRAASGAA